MQKIQKVNLAILYNEKEEYKSQNRDTTRDELQLIQKFRNLLNQKIIPTDQLKGLAWQGIPSELRGQVWKILLKYSSPNKDANVLFIEKQFTIMERKRNQYYEMCNIYFAVDQQYDDKERRILKLISDDVKRTLPDAPIFRNSTVQSMLEKILFIWNIRNPACGYVQGINDIVSPFLITFMQEYIDIDTKKMAINPQLEKIDPILLKQVEADTYWSLCKFLESILDNYTQYQPGLKRFHERLVDITTVLDKKLINHLQEEKIDLFGFVFKWSNCVLLRLFSFDVGLRLFDTYMAEDYYFNEVFEETLETQFRRYNVFIRKIAYKIMDRG
ncbi:hypothetical protein pb186bvf_008697 [Paramecium bursaria]